MSDIKTKNYIDIMNILSKNKVESIILVANMLSFLDFNLEEYIEIIKKLSGLRFKLITKTDIESEIRIKTYKNILNLEKIAIKKLKDIKRINKIV